MIMLLVCCPVSAEEPPPSAPPGVTEPTTTPTEPEPVEPAVSESFLSSLLGDIPTLLGRLIAMLDPAELVKSFKPVLWGFVIDAVDTVYTLTLTIMTAGFFNNAYVVESLGFFRFLSFMILAASLVFSLFSMLEKEMHGDYSDRKAIAFNFIKAWGMLLLVQPVVMLTNDWIFRTSDMLSNVSLTNSVSEAMSTLTAPARLATLGVYDMILLIVIAIVSVIVMLAALSRYAVLYIQILTGYLYVFDVGRGNTNAIGEWGKDVLAGCITFGMQFICYRIGMVMIANGIVFGDIPGTIVGLAFMVGASTAGATLKKWGTAIQKQRGQGMTQLVNVGMMAARALV